ncbi:DUF1127 domain-containing protein [Rhizobium alvei]|uniref:DUF1127 domain-containing protein n=1 Tax=Rhizobium alvei TaxID=1132659 RepID=A0ABT8YJI6_9HYPH|nr:DUF1127 domain-containing protein [Rhizobium alvei]MDO6963764.1 DUF1127 domain-containing protein [Rhizobium alvei]
MTDFATILPSHSVLETLESYVHGVTAAMARYLAARTAAHQLARLPDTLLADVGIEARLLRDTQAKPAFAGNHWL